MRRSHPLLNSCSSCPTDDQQGSTAPKTRKERQPFSIDFEGEPSQTRKELFASSSVSTTLPKPKGGRRRSARSGSGNDEKSKNDNTLPDDMHFNSQQLLRLFLKPKAIVSTESVVLGRFDAENRRRSTCGDAVQHSRHLMERLTRTSGPSRLPLRRQTQRAAMTMMTVGLLSGAFMG